MNGNSCSGAAEAAPENATVANASAPKAARRELRFNASGLNMVVPCLEVCLCALSFFSAPLRRSVRATSTGRRFQNVCVETAKWFRHGKEIFRQCVVGNGKT